jgi:membrane protein
MRVADLRAAFRRVVARARALAYRILDTVPPVRRTVDELVRVEVVDRSMVIGAQALFALVPLLIVIAAFLPDEAISLGLERFQDVTGIGAGGREAVEHGVEEVNAGAGVDTETVRTTTGVVGVLITLFSASSFAKAVQRMYERVWEQPHIAGFVGRRRCLAWLLGWLVALQAVGVVGWVKDSVDLLVLDPFWFVIKGAVATLVWWWTLRVLLFGRVPWHRLLVTAALTGYAVTTYTSGSTLVMPKYVASSAAQFGTLGLVLSVATWLVGFAGVLVVSAVVGRVVVEDPTVTKVARRLLRRWVPRPASGPAPPPPAGPPPRSPAA